MKSMQVSLAFAVLATAAANEDVFDSILMQLNAVGNTQLDSFGPTYVLGDYAGSGDDPAVDDCPDGFTIIDTSSECESAATVLGLTYRGSTAVVTQFVGSTYTAGCSLRRNSPSFAGAWFNPTLTGSYDGHSMTGETAPICKASTSTPSPTTSPTPSPTPSPTAVPTPSPTANPTVGAIGDPHMTSVTGAKFDIVRPGNYTLLHIPRFSENALIDVSGVVSQKGMKCQDMYISSLDITGKWAEDQQPGGFSFFADKSSRVSRDWMTFGKVQIKIVHGATFGGVSYLNVITKHLAELGMPIGGLLGLDDHTYEATPDQNCKRTISLMRGNINIG